MPFCTDCKGFIFARAGRRRCTRCVNAPYRPRCVDGCGKVVSRGGARCLGCVKTANRHDAIEMRAAGLSYNDIAFVLGVSPQMVMIYLRGVTYQASGPPRPCKDIDTVLGVDVFPILPRSERHALRRQFARLLGRRLPA